MKNLNDIELQELSILLTKIGKEKLKLTGLQIFQLVNIELGVRGYEFSDELKNQKIQNERTKQLA